MCAGCESNASTEDDDAVAEKRREDVIEKWREVPHQFKVCQAAG